MFAEDISGDFSDLTFTLDFIVFLDIFEIFAEDRFLLRSFRKFLPSGFLPLSRFCEREPATSTSLRFFFFCHGPVDRGFPELGSSVPICPFFALFRVHAKGVVLCERACFCLLSTF